MIELPLATNCRLSGESLASAKTLFEVPDCPLPGIYPTNAAESISLRAPLKVVQAQRSGFVQLAHVFDSALYQQYAFSGAASSGYVRYLDGFAQDIANSLPPSASVLEIGCGDGTLLERLHSRGFGQVYGIDPSRPARAAQLPFPIATGYFPADLPSTWPLRLDLIVLRHVLEHIETPRAFAAALDQCLSPSGQLWIEVPDLDSTVKRQLWSNFYHLHCNYFEASTLDALLAEAGFACTAGFVSEVFGGSLVRKYKRMEAANLSPPTRWSDVEKQVQAFARRLEQLGRGLPARVVGYGAAERTAVTLGICPPLQSKLVRLFDANRLLAGRFLGGTELPIEHSERLSQEQPAAVVLFAISHVEEILTQFKRHLPGTTMIGIAGRDFTCQPLARFTLP